ncbi:MAG: hypothetical protein EPN88_09980 [Bacteroidetes bacterium]|nr:MAG: hypothetical protein EPN88_09980 [Bacteroidota bacterium]
MKLFILICFFVLLSNKTIIAQTYANNPRPENVLVVYNKLDSTSIQVKNYYQTARGIPQVNIVGLEQLIDNVNIFDPVSNTTHLVRFNQQGEILEDAFNEENHIEIPTRHSWIYFNERILKPTK